jgi:phosphoglycolate phosphatase
VVVTVRVSDRPFPGIEAVLFDKDGTLADASQFLSRLARARVLAIQARIPEIDDRLLASMGVQGDLFNPFGLMAVGTRYENCVAAAAYVAESGCSWAMALMLVQQAFAEADRQCGDKAAQTPPYNDTADCLARLAKAGLKLAILTGDTLSHTQDFLNRYDLARWVQAIGAADTGPSKPDPVSVVQLCDRMDVSPDRVLLVGDSEIDMQVARLAGVIGAIGIDRHRRSPQLPQARLVPPKTFNTHGIFSTADVLPADAIVYSLDAIQVATPAARLD